MEHKLFIKRLTSQILSYSGIFSVLSKKSNDAIILMYHRITNKEKDNSDGIQPGMYVSPRSFRSHLKYLKKNYTVLPLSKLIDRHNNGLTLKGYCSITFDDGWLDNYSEAYPLLREYKLPATIFLATGYIGTNEMFWPEKLVYYLSQVNFISSTNTGSLLERLKIDLKSDAKYSGDVFEKAIIALKKWSPKDRQKLLSHLKNQCKNHPSVRLLMNWDEVIEMQKSGLIEFGAHTVNHVILDQVKLEEAEREISQSRSVIYEKLGIMPELFAYPNGNYTSEIKELLKKHGFKAAVITRKGKLGKNHDLYEIPRIGVHQDISSTIPLLQARIIISGF